MSPTALLDSPALTVEGGTAVTLAGNPDFGHVVARIPPGATLLVESGAMASMSQGMQVKSRLMGGVFKALIRKVLGGESLFVGEYSHPQGGEIALSPAIPGMVVHRKLNGETLLFQGGAFLACTPGITLGTQFGGLRALLGGEGLFFLKVSGQGDLFFNAIGSIVEREVNGSLVVDTGHLVGWESSLNWTIRGMGGLKATLLSGEGLVLEFNGRGKVWLQTRTEGGLVGWVGGYCRG